jgi:hypothetical protein
MKKIIVILFAFTLLVSCGEMQWKIDQKNTKSRWEGLNREITITNARTDKVLFQRTGVCLINDNSKPNDIEILFREKDMSFSKVNFSGDIIMSSVELLGGQ